MNNVINWLLDPADPGPRYLALRDVCRLAADDPELVSARAAAHAAPPLSTILDAMHPDGYWVKPGPGYNPKYRSTVWAMIALWQLGATAAADERIGRAGRYLLDHALAPGGQFSSTSNGAPSGTIDCLQGNLLAALLAMGVDDPRLDGALEWMARTVTGEGMAPAEERMRLRSEPRPAGAPRPRQPKGVAEPPRYYAYKSGPLFACGINGGLPCAWGGAKVMAALGLVPTERQTPLIAEATRQGIEFFLSTDLATAGYPSAYGDRPNRGWWKFGFPVFYVTDILQVMEALVALGVGDDPRLANARAHIASKADAEGRWRLEYDYAGKMGEGVAFGVKGEPNKWVTIRARRTTNDELRTTNEETALHS